MFDLLVTGVAAVLYYSGLVGLGRWLTRRRSPKLLILCYHRADGKQMRQHLLYLKRHYRLMHLEPALRELYNPEHESMYQSDRRLPLVITFDDGYQDSYSSAFELARTLHIPLTIFLVPGYIDSTNSFWWHEGSRLSTQTQMHQVTLEGHSYILDTIAGRKAVAQAIDHVVFHAPSVRSREAYLASARNALGIPEVEASSSDTSCTSLSWEQIQMMEKSGWISFGGHTMNHPVLAYLSDPTEAEYEVNRCRTVLEQHLDHSIRLFAYPVGQLEHIGRSGPLIVQKAGFAWAVTTIEGFNMPDTSPYLLHRFVLDKRQSWLLVAAKTSGAWTFITHPYRLLLKVCRRPFRSHE
ncbi:MAG: polysaccharide deacetylase family protein [Ktedonobacteraceae bacterium]|nr:polysaccharide deacetylase family protein [Ktedonobacteraceae bacterium]